MIIRSRLSISPFVLVEHTGFRYLAVIQNGMQIGALAQTADGRYVQVNGAVVQPLNADQVQRALRRERPSRDQYRKPAAPPSTAAVPLVSVRRRRRVPAEALLMDDQALHRDTRLAKGKPRPACSVESSHEGHFCP